jgi:hypothetical protein
VVISRELAVRLRPLLDWAPQNADRFFIPREEIAEAVFIVSDMVVELIHAQGESNFHFNGTTEWALDSVSSEVAVWLPSEQQLRDALGDAFLSLDRVGDGFVVSSAGPSGAHHTPPVPDASDAYALALLHTLGGDDSLPAGDQVITAAG